MFLLKKYGYLIGINSEISNIDADIISVKVYEEINRQLDKAAKYVSYRNARFIR